MNCGGSGQQGGDSTCASGYSLPGLSASPTRAWGVAGRKVTVSTFALLGKASSSEANARGQACGAHGRAIAAAKGLDGKHAIKQADRFFSNTGVDVWKLFASWVPFVIGSRPEVVVALDWTDFDQYDQTTIALYLITKHGRATPLAWKGVVKSELEGGRRGPRQRPATAASQGPRHQESTRGRRGGLREGEGDDG